MDVFPNVAPDVGWTRDRAPRILNAQFGDGYSQRLADGINTNPETLGVTWTNIQTADRDLIMDFLDAKNGIEAFLFAPDMVEANQKQYTCAKYQDSAVEQGWWKVTATFVQSFDLTA